MKKTIFAIISAIFVLSGCDNSISSNDSNSSNESESTNSSDNSSEE